MTVDPRTDLLGERVELTIPAREELKKDADGFAVGDWANKKNRTRHPERKITGVVRATYTSGGGALHLVVQEDGTGQLFDAHVSEARVLPPQG